MSKGKFAADCSRARQLQDAFIADVERALEGARYPDWGYGDYEDLKRDVLERCLERHEARKVLAR